MSFRSLHELRADHQWEYQNQHNGVTFKTSVKTLKEARSELKISRISLKTSKIKSLR